MNARISQILRLAIPSIISNITVPLLGLVDVGIVGHIGDAKYIGAIAVGTMLFNVIYWIFGFLRMGTGGMTSQAYGHRDFKEVIRLLIRTLTIGLVIGFLFIILQIPLIQFGLWVARYRHVVSMLEILFDMYLGSSRCFSDVWVDRLVCRYAKYSRTHDGFYRPKYIEYYFQSYICLRFSYGHFRSSYRYDNSSVGWVIVFLTSFTPFLQAAV